MKCLTKKCKGYYCITSMKDKKGLSVYECEKCGSITI
jgi:hypothetical protein